MEFSGFRDEAFAYFKELTENNSEEWFEANQGRFDEFVLAPMRHLVVSLREDLRRLHPALVQDDIDAHFSEMRRGPHSRPGSAPIKTSFYSFFWDSSVRRLNDGWFFVGVGADGVTIGMSIYDFGDPECRMRRIFKPRLRRYLTHLDDYIKANYLRRGFDFHRYVRAAGKLGIREVDPFPTAAAEWDSTLGWVVKRHLHTESSRLTPGSFLTEVKESFERLYPLYSFTSDPREEFLRLVRVPMRARVMHASVAAVAPPKAALQNKPAPDPVSKTEDAAPATETPKAAEAKAPAKRKRASKTPQPTEAAPESTTKQDKAPAKRAPSKKATPKAATGSGERATKKADPKSAAVKKAKSKKAPAVKARAKKAVSKKASTKKSAAKKKAVAKKTTAKKSAKKKSVGKKSPSKRVAKKSAVKKPATKRPTKKKVAAKKKTNSKSGKRATSSSPRASARAR